MQSFVATSTAANAADAGKEAAAKVAAGIQGAKVALAYGSCDYDSAALLGAIAAELPGVPVLGMHAPFEVTSKLDCYMSYRAMKAIFEQ